MDQTIARIAEQLGFQATRIWPQVVAVTWITGAFWLVADPFIIVACVITIVRSIKMMSAAMREAQTDFEAAKAKGNYVSSLDYDASGFVFICLAACGVAGVIGVAVLVGFPDQLAAVLYPEAVTVMKIAKGLK